MVKQYVPGSAGTPKDRSNMSPTTSPVPLSPDLPSSSGQWVFEEKGHEVKAGFQLAQVVSCSTSFSGCSASGRESVTSTSSSRIPVTVSKMQYSTDIGL